MLSSSSSSNHSISSFVPSIAFEMLHILNDFSTASTLISSHDFTTHSQRVASGAVLLQLSVFKSNFSFILSAKLLVVYLNKIFNESLSCALNKK